MKGNLLIIITQLMIGLVASLCNNYDDATNATYGDLAEKTQYIKYIAIDFQEVHNVFSSEVDSIILKTSRLGESNNYNHTFQIIRKSRNVTTTSRKFTVNDTTHTLLDNGLPQKYHIVSYKPDTYALIYLCLETKNITARMLCTTNISNDVSQALEDDKKYKFTNPLVELPFVHKDLITI